MKASICIASYNHAPLLRRTLASIYAQHPPFDFEVVVANDGSTDDTAAVLAEFSQVRAAFLPRKECYTNPSRARNVAYKTAVGEIIISQSDDVVHSPGVIQGLVETMKPGHVVMAGVRSVHGLDDRPPEDWPCATPEFAAGWYAHSANRPDELFFLGALYRSDLYAIGGNDERFTTPCYDDNWFRDCLLIGLGLKTIWRDDLIGYHQWHDRSGQPSYAQSQGLYATLMIKCRLGDEKYIAQGGPWPYTS